MSQDHLGIYDTPPNHQQVRLSLAIVALLFLVLPLTLIAPNTQLAQIHVFVPMIDTAMLLCDLIAAILLYVQATVFRSRALTVLATGYVFSALMLVAHVLTFPGAFAPDGLLGAEVNTTGWVANFWRATLPVSIILYVRLKQVDSAQTLTERPAVRIAAWALAALALAAAATMLATIGHDLLPSLFVDRYHVNHANLARFNYLLMGLFGLSLISLFRHRGSVLDLWLLVALSAWLIHTLLNMNAWSRFTLIFYVQFGLLLFSNFVVLLALIVESSRLYARLALSTAARNRERDARLMSMDAVAAAISHEVGQPLTAVTTNATAGLSWLNRPTPDPERAIKALRATLDAANRTFEVIRSVRAMFAKGSARTAEFSLNELVRDTVSLLDRELVAAKVALHFSLDESLPPILADRVQLQRVLINLLTNAIESVAEVPGRPRRISIRSRPLAGQGVLLEVSDTGIGIAPDQMADIFEAFFTTKSTGTGLGLSLCRTIIEEHGGRLWASAGEEHGATFHLQLPAAASSHLDKVESYG